MSRWHAVTCVSPGVVLNGGLPICNTCGAVPDLDAIRLEQQQTSPFPPIPPDEPPGQFNLHWPLSSLYSYATDTKTRQGSAGNSNESLRCADNFEPSPIYQRRLEAHEFRLLRLDAAPHDMDLLHIHLETHDQQRFPMYETVSYTWGGENDDNSRCWPVFIGPFWDVLLQTQNCWDMLKFLRPADGLRRLWVDAICINQKDDEERGAQVSKMADIYREAQRVVVYLGCGLIDSASPHEYPLRQKFEHSIMQSNDSGHLVKDGKVDVNKLLTMRYFSRLWVIQELVVSRQVVFQVGDTEFWADGATVPHLKGHDWENTSAPWLAHMAQGTAPGSEIYDAMRATWSSKASDPRDKIFGVLALLDDHRGRELFRPDYSLSSLHVYIGALAYSLLGQKRVEILCHAAGRSAPDGQPSWMIDRNISTWPAHCDLQDQAELTFKSWERVWPGEQAWPPRHDLRPMAWSPRKPFAPVVGVGQVNILNTRLGHGSFTLSRFSSQYKRRERGDYGRYFTDIDDKALQGLKEESWDNGASVDASTGSLTINLTRICGFAVVPSKVHTHGSMMIFEVQGAAPNEAWMYLITEMPLDHLVIPGSDHLFILDQGNDKSFVILILRKVDDGPTFRLIGCCYGLYFRFSPGPWSGPAKDNKYFLSDLRVRLPLGHIPGSITRSEDFVRLLCLQPDGLNERQLNTFIHEFLHGSASELPRAYCESIHPRFRPAVNGQYVEISVHPGAWHYILDSAPMDRFLQLYTEMRYEKEEDWTSSRLIWRLTGHATCRSRGIVQLGELNLSAIKQNKPLYLRASLGNFLAAMDELTSTETLPGYRSRRRSNARFYMPPETILGEESDMVTCPIWPRPILEGFTIDGRMYRVCIA